MSVVEEDGSMSEYGESNSGVASGNKNAGDVLLVDDPLPGVRRLTMNRPEKRNSLIHPLRGAILRLAKLIRTQRLRFLLFVVLDHHFSWMILPVGMRVTRYCFYC